MTAGALEPTSWRILPKSSMSLSSSASNSPGTLKAQSQHLGLIASAGRLAPKDSNKDAASSSQAWQSDVDPSSSAGRPAHTTKTQRVIDKDWPNYFEISASVVGHLEKVHSNLRHKIGRRPGDEMLDLNVNSLIWRMFASATMDAAVHVGPKYLDNSHSTRNTKERKKDKTIVRRVTEVDFESRRNRRDIYD